MRERSLVAFTLLAQMAVGLFWALSLLWWATAGAPGEFARTSLLAVGPLLGAAILASALHLGSPRNAWRALCNLRTSWLSREILFLALFGAGWAAFAASVWSGAGPPGLPATLAWFAGGSGGGLIYSMARVYRVRTVPAWDTPLTTATFFLTVLSLGPLAAAVMVGAAGGAAAAGPELIVAGRMLVALAGAALALELWLEAPWRARRRAAAAAVDVGLNPLAGGAGDDVRRQTLLVVALALVVATPIADLMAGGPPADLLIGLALAAALAAAVKGRSRFYRSHARRGV
jgi:anaerobic dimethyl sulfoxide reductase subunit C